MRDETAGSGHATPYDAALAVINRYRFGWDARRDSFGFLMWNRGAEWQGMSDYEARAWLDADQRWMEAAHAS